MPAPSEETPPATLPLQKCCTAFCGKFVEEMTREELIACVMYCAGRIKELEERYYKATMRQFT
jgi:hypothetical protein